MSKMYRSMKKRGQNSDIKYSTVRVTEGGNKNIYLYLHLENTENTEENTQTWEERRENRINGQRMELLMFESCDCLTYGKNMYFKILHGRILHSELTVAIQEYR